MLPPYATSGDSGVWYKGTANAIYQNIGFIDLYDPEYVLILSGDHIYKMDYAKMLAYHKQTGADVTISVLAVSYTHLDVYKRQAGKASVISSRCDCPEYGCRKLKPTRKKQTT